jgi:hypothetical protein
MVARVMGHQKITTTLPLYTRRTDDESRILDGLTDKLRKRMTPDDDRFRSAGYLLTLASEMPPSRTDCVGGRYWD